MSQNGSKYSSSHWRYKNPLLQVHLLKYRIEDISVQYFSSQHQALYPSNHTQDKHEAMPIFVSEKDKSHQINTPHR